MAARAGGMAGTWAHQSYAHLTLPVPVLGDAEVALVDRAVGDQDGWRPVAEDTSSVGPVLIRRWGRQRGGQLVLVVLGWYPVLFTVSDLGRTGRAGRRARGRIADAVLGAGGGRVADVDLAARVHEARQRWAAVVSTQRRLSTHLPLVDYRYCACCASWSATSASHCRGCGHRFTSQEDMDRDALARSARAAVARATVELAALGRGDDPSEGVPPPGRVA